MLWLRLLRQRVRLDFQSDSERLKPVKKLGRIGPAALGDVMSLLNDRDPKLRRFSNQPGCEIVSAASQPLRQIESMTCGI